MELEIGGRRIGASEPLFVIAEIGLNHNGSLDRALALVDAAAAAGASAIKLQTLVAEELVAPGCPPPAHVASTSLTEFFRQFELDEAAHRALAARARALSLAFMATPFSIGAVDLLERVGVDAYKIASGDVNYDELIERCARTGRPIVVSTGMASLAETAHAIAHATMAGARDVALLHCVSAYPVPSGSENLGAIATIRHAFERPVGLSDHGSNPTTIAVALAFGACIYERHLILERGDDAIDAAVSSTPDDLAAAIALAATAQAAIGHGRKECLPAEAVNMTASRRALRARTTLRAGHVVAPADVVALRPAVGLPPNRLGDLVGARLTRNIDAGAPFLDIDVAVSRSRSAAA